MYSYLKTDTQGHKGSTAERYIYIYPYKWLVLSVGMIHTSRVLRPVYHCLDCMFSTHQQMSRLHILITSTPSTFAQYTIYKAKYTLQLFPEITSKLSITYGSLLSYNANGGILHEYTQKTPSVSSSQNIKRYNEVFFESCGDIGHE